VSAQATQPATQITNPGQFLELTESLRTKNHPQFVQKLKQIHLEAPPLTASEQWYLRYLDAWETMYEADYSKSKVQLQDIIDNSGDATLAAKASSLLLTNLAFNRQYEKAFALANRLTLDLPNIHDPQARFQVLTNLSQMLNIAGQTDLAVKYAQMMEGSVPEGSSLCYPRYLQIAALHGGKRLTSSSPQLQQAVDICVAAGQPVLANAAWLIQSSLYLNENKPREAKELLDRIAPSIQTTGYQIHLFSAQVQRAQTYEQLGDDSHARQVALVAIATAKPDDGNEWLKEAYQVLYQIDKKHGNMSAALDDYEHYVAQDKSYINDVSARNLAFQTVQQQVLTRKLETEELSKQNSILRLQQALDAKAVEASRLYIALLLMTLVSIAIWLYRVKRSQLRFKKLSCHDGLTGIMNHQHFVSEAHRVLLELEKNRANACLVSIDLDHFKKVNDNHGHAMGDAVLKSAVAVCQPQLRPSDLFGRLGGEEFGILLQHCDRAQGMDIADRIRLAISHATVKGEDCDVAISASVGLACTDISGYDLQRLCIDADDALYRAKRAGRNRVIANIADSKLLGA